MNLPRIPLKTPLKWGFLALSLVTLWGSLGYAVEPVKAPIFDRESDYQVAWCYHRNGEVEYILPDRTRVDCLVDGYAIEFDYAKKWAEAIGQSLYYAYHTEHLPGIVLIMETAKDCKYLLRLYDAKHEGNLGIRVWETGAYAYSCLP